jgi:hypothetical protein
MNRRAFFGKLVTATVAAKMLPAVSTSIDNGPIVLAPAEFSLDPMGYVGSIQCYSLAVSNYREANEVNAKIRALLREQTRAKIWIP